MEQRIWSDSHGVRAKGSGSQLQTKTYKKSAPEAEFWEWDLCCDSHCSTELSAASAVGLQRSGLFPVLQQEPGQGPALQSQFQCWWRWFFFHASLRLYVCPAVSGTAARLGCDLWLWLAPGAPARRVWEALAQGRVVCLCFRLRTPRGVGVPVQSPLCLSKGRRAPGCRGARELHAQEQPLMKA